MPILSILVGIWLARRSGPSEADIIAAANWRLTQVSTDPYTNELRAIIAKSEGRIWPAKGA